MQVMQSNKWTFSLASFVMFLAIGLIFVPTAMAGVDTVPAPSLSVMSDKVDLDGSYSDGAALEISLKFDIEVTVPTAANVAAGVREFDENGVIDATGVVAGDITVTQAMTPPDSKSYTVSIADTALDAGHTLIISFNKDLVTNANLADIQAATKDGKTLLKNKVSNVLKITLVAPDAAAPTVLDDAGAAITTGSPFTVVGGTDRFGRGASGPFTLKITFSEQPVVGGTKLQLADDKHPFTITNGSITKIVAAPLMAITGGTTTGRSGMFHPYFLTIEPDLKEDGDEDVTVKLGAFTDTLLPTPNQYAVPATGMLMITVVVDPDATSADSTVEGVTKTQREAKLPHEYIIADGKVIPANGYLVITNGPMGQAGVLGSVDKIVDKKRVGETDYNIIEKAGFPYPGNDLQNEFRNGATIQLVYKNIANNPAEANADTGYNGGTDDVVAAGDVIINEIMWGRDEGLTGTDENRLNSQWIELRNTTNSPISIDKGEWFIVFGTSTSLTDGVVVDTVGNDPDSGYWQVPGNGGVSVVTDKAPTLIDLVSMVRVMGATDGTAMASWKASTLPSANIAAAKNHIATPGAENVYEPDPVVPAPPPPPPPPAPTPTAVAMKDDIAITEIMADSGNGKFPQWVELTNKAAGEVSLDGWSLNISNDPADADALGSSLVIDLSGNTLGVSAHPGNMGKGQSLLVIAYSGRGSDNLGNVAIIDASDADQLDQTGRYMLLSETAFKLVLMPPQATGITVYGDMAGNLDNGAAAWALPMSEGMRSSLIRMEMDTADMATMGTSSDGWRQASMTDLASGQITWYGSDEDAGTPGYDAGGPLPVELSMFYPKRDQLTGQVVITWETQSELNNAGFFIKRSEAKDGDFKVINPTMIQGAGTTSEKQSYTYTDTSAKPNVVYYYQIEDVSLDGQRQTLTLGTRLRGHIGAAGKATTTWGELKNVQE